MNKNTTAIDKIIAQLAYRDYRVANPLKANGRPKYKRHHPYSLGEDTNEAREIKENYLSGNISENEYKGYCLKFNLTHKDLALPESIRW